MVVFNDSISVIANDIYKNHFNVPSATPAPEDQKTAPGWDYYCRMAGLISKFIAFYTKNKGILSDSETSELDQLKEPGNMKVLQIVALMQGLGVERCKKYLQSLEVEQAQLIYADAIIDGAKESKNTVFSKILASAANLEEAEGNLDQVCPDIKISIDAIDGDHAKSKATQDFEKLKAEHQVVKKGHKERIFSGDGEVFDKIMNDINILNPAGAAAADYSGERTDTPPPSTPPSADPDSTNPPVPPVIKKQENVTSVDIAGEGNRTIANICREIRFAIKKDRSNNLLKNLEEAVKKTPNIANGEQIIADAKAALSYRNNHNPNIPKLFVGDKKYADDDFCDLSTDKGQEINVPDVGSYSIKMLDTGKPEAEFTHEQKKELSEEKIAKMIVQMISGPLLDGNKEIKVNTPDPFIHAFATQFIEELNRHHKDSKITPKVEMISGYEKPVDATSTKAKELVKGMMKDIEGQAWYKEVYKQAATPSAPAPK